MSKITNKLTNGAFVIMYRNIKVLMIYLQVQKRVQSKPALERKIDAQLKEIGTQFEGLRFGKQEFSLVFLGNSSEFLLMVLQFIDSQSLL